MNPKDPQLPVDTELAIYAFFGAVMLGVIGAVIYWGLGMLGEWLG
jgi:hypothetical protein